MSEPIVDLLEIEWQEMANLASGFTDEQWEVPTELPGWSVKDCYSHVVGTEQMVRSEPAPEVDLSGLTHLTAPSSAVTEPPVHLRRSRSGADVLAEFRQITQERIAELKALPPDKWEEVGFTPAGPGPFREFMNIRAFDCWMHEQDVRRALGLPGNVTGPVAEHAMRRCEMAMGYVVGKKAAAPNGSSVTFEITGPISRTIPVVVDGRAAVVDSAPADPTVTIRMAAETFWCLGGGRWDPDQVLADGKVEIIGDRQLGETVVRSMNFMI